MDAQLRCSDSRKANQFVDQSPAVCRHLRLMMKILFAQHGRTLPSRETGDDGMISDSGVFELVRDIIDEKKHPVSVQGSSPCPSRGRAVPALEGVSRAGVVHRQPEQVACKPTEYQHQVRAAAKGSSTRADG